MKFNKIIIIAEAGVNHNGNLSIAKKLISKAADAGADIIKFQTFKASRIVTKNSPKANYQLKKTNKSETQFQMLKKLELDDKDHKKLIKYSIEKKIEFLSTPFDLESAKFLKSLNIKKIKVASGEITNYPLLKYIAKQNKFTILSTGMSSISEISKSINYLMKNGLNKKNLNLLHCTTSYPTKSEDVNLRAILFMKKQFNLNIGYSDHTLGIDVPIAAAAIGAHIIEKHITLDKKMKGPDHDTSLDPKEFKHLVKSIRNVEKSLGLQKKIVTSIERKNKKIIRKSIFASKEIKKGEKLTEKNMCVKRPAVGASPILWEKFLGLRARKNYNKDEPIK